MYNIKKSLKDILNALILTKEQREDLEYYITNSYELSNNAYSEIEYLEDYLYYMKYNQNHIDYNIANEHFREKARDINYGFCSAIRASKYLFRNFDWKYNKDSIFVIKTNRAQGRFKSYSVASAFALNNAFVNSGEYSEKYKLLPFYISTGINENSVSVTVNVVPKDYGDTNQNISGKKEMCAIMIPRYVLDYASSAEQICNDIKNNFNIYCPTHNELHFLIADINETYSIEFINNETVVTKLTTNPFMTNFHLYNTVVENGEIDYSSISDFGSGVERYQYVLDNYKSSPTLTEIKTMLHDLLYTNAYTKLTNPWLTEFVGSFNHTELKVSDAKNNPSKFDAVLAYARNLYANRKRDGKTWQTVYSLICDLESKTLYIGCQEQNIKYSFTLSNDYEIL